MWKCVDCGHEEDERWLMCPACTTPEDWSKARPMHWASGRCWCRDFHRDQPTTLPLIPYQPISSRPQFDLPNPFRIDAVIPIELIVNEQAPRS